MSSLQFLKAGGILGATLGEFKKAGKVKKLSPSFEEEISESFFTTKEEAEQKQLASMIGIEEIESKCVIE